MREPRLPFVSCVIGLCITLFGAYFYIKYSSESPNRIYKEVMGECQGIMLFGIAIIAIGIVWYVIKLNKYKKYKANPSEWWSNYFREHSSEIAEKKRKMDEENAIIQQEKEYAIRSQTSGSPWERYYTHPCPYCGHFKVRPAKWDDKRMSVAFWGVASSKIGTRYKCEYCNRMWS